MTVYTGMIRTLRKSGLKPGVLAEFCIEHGYTAILGEGSNAIDGGANVGRHTLFMSRCVGESGTIFACEPAAEAVVKLRSRLREVNARNVVLLCFALSDTLDVVDFTVCRKATWYSSLRPTRTLPENIAAELDMRKVLACPLDDAIPTNRKIDFIKLDLEGGEFPALRGARALIARDRPLIVFENGRQKSAETFGYTEEDFFGFFDALDYDLSTIDGRPFERAHWTALTSVFYFWATPRESTALYRERIGEWTEKAFQSVRERSSLTEGEA